MRHFQKLALDPDVADEVARNMSIHAIKSVFEFSRSRGTARLVLLALADHANIEMIAWPSVETLRRKVNLLHKRNVHTVLNTLLDLGEIEKVGMGRRGVVRYRLLIAIRQPDQGGRTSDVAGDTPDCRITSAVTDGSEDPLSQETPEPSLKHQRTIKGLGEPNNVSRENVLKECRSFLESCGLSEERARKHVGKWCRDLSDDISAFSDLLEVARRKVPADPVSFIEALIREKNRAASSPVLTPRRRPKRVV